MYCVLQIINMHTSGNNSIFFKSRIMQTGSFLLYLSRCKQREVSMCRVKRHLYTTKLCLFSLKLNKNIKQIIKIKCVKFKNEQYKNTKKYVLNTSNSWIKAGFHGKGFGNRERVVHKILWICLNSVVLFDC